MPPDTHLVVLFGAGGDLAQRRLLPALYRLFVSQRIAGETRIVGASLQPFSVEAFRRRCRRSVERFASHRDMERWRDFEKHLTYVCCDEQHGGVEAVARAVAHVEVQMGAGNRRLLYLAVPPASLCNVLRDLAATGLLRRSRVIVDKPFGVDPISSRGLEQDTQSLLSQDQLYIADHYLAKRSLADLIELRCANRVLESAWNAHQIDHVRIDVTECDGIRDRGQFYDQTGALRDMVVTHLLQAVAVVAMEPPKSFDPRALHEAKANVLAAIRPLDPRHVVRGQFHGYLDIPGVRAGSGTETFVAAHLAIDNERWMGVPFLLRTGKRLSSSAQTITVAFKPPAHQSFDRLITGQRLVIDLAGGTSVSFFIPGAASLTDTVLRLDDGDHSPRPQPHERLLWDAMVGDHTLFTSTDSIRRTWQIVAPVLQHPPPLLSYAPGSQGPRQADELLAADLLR